MIIMKKIIEPGRIVLYGQPFGTNDDTIAQIIYDPGDQQHDQQNILTRQNITATIVIFEIKNIVRKLRFLF